MEVLKVESSLSERIGHLWIKGLLYVAFLEDDDETTKKNIMQKSSWLNLKLFNFFTSQNINLLYTC